METGGTETTPSGTNLLQSQRGAGGKFRKPSSRRPPLTPYARPQQNQNERNSSRWLSKFVDPACRLISGGATLFFPSFFSKSQHITTTQEEHREEEEDDDDDRGKSRADVAQNASVIDHEVNLTLNNVASTSTGQASTGRIAEEPKTCSGFDGHEQYQRIDLPDHNGLSEIEQLMKDKHFSRDEINRLIEIIRSREVDRPDVDQGNKYSGMSVGEVRESTVAHKDSGKSTEEKQNDLNGAAWGTSKIPENNYLRVMGRDIGEPELLLENSRKPTEDKHEIVNIANWGSQTPLCQSTVRDDVGTSPVEIARAYMESRSLEAGFGSKNLISKDEATPSHINAVASKPFIQSPSPKPSTCWPGALVRDQHGYTTPQSQRGRFEPHNFPRTPYSRTIYSKSQSKLPPFQGNSGRSLYMKQSPFQQSETPAYGQVNTRGNALDDGNGSVGPIRRIRQKVIPGTSYRGSAYLRTPLASPSHVENFNISEGFLSTVKKNSEKGETSNLSKFLVLDSKPPSSENAVSNVPPHSRQMARKILEHLERNPPTPKDKSAELKLATSWKRSQFSDGTSEMLNKNDSLSHFGVLGSKQPDQVDKKILFNWKEDGQSLSNSPAQKDVNETNDAVQYKASPSEIKVSCTIPTHHDDAGPRKSWDASHIIVHEDVLKGVPNAVGSGLQSLQNKAPSHPLGNKPVLPSISIGKPNQRWTLSSDRSSGFTFPVSASSGILSEPPTPSIMPSSSTSGLHSSNDVNAVPSYTFGSKRSTPLVFSFPSTSDAPALDDASNLQFKFGSDKTRTISFSSIGKDAICY